MRTIQKLELSSGIAALLAGVIQMIFSVFFQEHDENDTVIVNLVFSFLVLVLPVIAIFLGTYFHSTKGNMIGFGFLIFFSIIFLCFWGVITFFGLLFGGGVKNYAISMFILALPSFFVAFTMVFAIANTVKSSLRNYSV
jgi:hypothetical protein